VLLFVLNRFLSGGAEKQAFWLATALAREGVRCRILELMPARENARVSRWIQDAEARGIRVERAPADTMYWSATRRLRRVLHDEPRAWIWSWENRADVLVMLQVLVSPARVWLSSLRSARLEEFHRMRWVWRLGGRRVTRFIANTHASCEMLSRGHPRLRARCRVLYNAIETPAVPAATPASAEHAPKVPRLVMLGNLQVLTKGYDLALELMQRFQAAGVTAELHIAGRRDDAGWMEREIEARGLRGAVRLAGEVTAPAEFLRSGDIFLLLSRHEGTPNALLEALILGLPSVATAVGDLPAFAGEGAPFRVVPIGDVGATFAAVQDLLRDWRSAIEMGRRGQTWCGERFSPRTSLTRCLALLREIAVERGETWTENPVSS